jgi:hypothetical protein
MVELPVSALRALSAAHVDLHNRTADPVALQRRYGIFRTISPNARSVNTPSR